LLAVLLCLISVKSTAQKTNYIGLESGATLNKVFLSNVSAMDDGNTTSYYDYNLSYYSTKGFFIKASYIKTLFSKGHFSFQLPVTLGYQEVKNQYFIEGYYSGCFAFGRYNEMVYESVRMANLSFGTAIQYDAAKLMFSSSLLFNSTFKFSKIGNVYNRGLLSGQVYLGFRINKQVTIGPSVEIVYSSYAFARNQIRKNSTQYKDNNNLPYYVLGLNGKNIWINPGLRIQVKL
jgi:hypothetical protein